MFVCVPLGSVHGGPRAEAAAGQAELHTLQPASSGPPGTSPRQRDNPQKCSGAGRRPQMKTGSSSFSLIPLTVSLCCPQKREKRKEEEQRRKQWVDQEREKTLSRLRSFREVRLSHCLSSASPCSFSYVNNTPEAPASYLLNSIVHLSIKIQLLTTQLLRQRELWCPSAVVVDMLCNSELSHTRALNGAWRTRAFPERKVRDKGVHFGSLCGNQTAIWRLTEIRFFFLSELMPSVDIKETF